MVVRSIPSDDREKLVPFRQSQKDLSPRKNLAIITLQLQIKRIKATSNVAIIIRSAFGNLVEQPMSASALGAALSSVATAAALASGGAYLHRRHYYQMDDGQSQQALARFSQQIAFPCLFFSRIVRCTAPLSTSQDDGDDDDIQQCSSVLDYCRDGAWILLLWPFYICGCGLLIGYFGARLSGTPRTQRGSVMVATGFANMTSLPLTLLTVIQENLMRQQPKGSATMLDFNQFLSVYLLVGPILVWSIGGWILSTEHEMHSVNDRTITSTNSNSIMRGIQEDENVEDEGQVDLVPLAPNNPARNLIVQSTDCCPDRNGSEIECSVIRQPTSQDASSSSSSLRAIQNFLSKAVQPPVVGALAGLFVTAIPKLRSLFVDITGSTTIDGGTRQPLLGWLFDAILCAGQASVPVSMAILGFNLSQAASQSHDNHVVSSSTIAAVVIGKLMVLPCIGVASARVLQQVWPVPHEIYTPFYLVLMIEFLPPTANNVMVLVDLTSSNKGRMKEAMARMIGFQYLVAPVLLSLWVMVVVRVATNQQG